MIEVDKQSFSLEPFLFVDNRLITWNDVSISQSLEKDYLPIPAVEWNYDKLNLQIKTFGEGKAGKSSIYIRYKIKNNSKQVKKAHSIWRSAHFKFVRPGTI